MELGLFLEFPVREGSNENEAFKESFALVDQAEDLGVPSVWMAEYHFNPGRVLASPVTILSAIAGRTRHIRLGTAVLLLPLANPVRVAEEMAMIDVISKGRLECGFVRSVPYEAAAASFEQVRGRNDLLAELATLGLAGVQRTSGKGEEAALAYRSLLDGGGDLPLDPVLFELGVLEEEQGRPEAAVSLYERIVEEYPASAFRDLAETRKERLPDPSR